MDVTAQTHLIKKEASRLGFSYCGISKAEFLEDEAPRFEKWLRESRNGEMHYLENHFDKRLDPRLLVPGAKSVISLLHNYSPQFIQPENKDLPKIAKYAYGKDYHQVIKEKLKQLFVFIRQNLGNVAGRFFADSAPVMEKAWAEKSGLGWRGKNSLLITRMAGSYFFIAELLLDVVLEYDSPTGDFCGNCTACIDVCPTEAIIKPHVVDGSKCISYFTIELKTDFSKTVVLSSDNIQKWKEAGWAFGCDICQDICPWNGFAKPHNESRLNPVKELFEMSKKDWLEMDETAFENIFKESPLFRAGLQGLKRNIAFLK